MLRFRRWGGQLIAVGLDREMDKAMDAVNVKTYCVQCDP